MSPIHSFGAGLLVAYLVYIAVEIFQFMYGDLNKSKNLSPITGKPEPDTLFRQAIIGGILMMIFALVRGFATG